MLPNKQNSLSSRALNIGVFALILGVFFVLLDGYLRGYLRNQAEAPGLPPAVIAMLGEWFYSLHFLCESVIGAAAIVFTGAKFLEARTVLSVGFDRVDAAKMAIKGPDAENVVWIGHRYGTKLEAESVFTMLENRLNQSADV
jgi:hypothetical protein